MTEGSRRERALALFDDEATMRDSSRHDAFNSERKRTFLQALAQCGCVRDAAAAAGVSPRTVYAHRDRDSLFAHNIRLALDCAGRELELHAWERGVVGVEEPVFAYGKLVGTRIKRSDAILKLLLQGANPEKYGPQPGFTRARLAAAYRKKIEQEVREEIDALDDDPDGEGALEIIRQRVLRIHLAECRKRRQLGWVRLDEFGWLPPGYVWAGEGPPPPVLEEDPEEADVRDSV